MFGLILSILVFQTGKKYPLSHKIEAFLGGRIEYYGGGYCFVGVNIVRTGEDYFIIEDDVENPDGAIVKLNSYTKIMLIKFQNLELLIGENPSPLDFENFAMNLDLEKVTNPLDIRFKNTFIMLNSLPGDVSGKRVFLICKMKPALSLHESIRDIKEIYIIEELR